MRHLIGTVKDGALFWGFWFLNSWVFLSTALLFDFESLWHCW